MNRADPLGNISSAIKIRIALGILVMVTIMGISGYMLIEDLPFLDALYMTIITIATVGFREVKELSMEGKMFTIFLIVISWGTFAYAISIITTHFVEGELQNTLRGYRLKSGLKKMKNHVIIIGYGRNGQQVASELEAHGEAYVVIDRNKDIVAAHSKDLMYMIEGDATDEEVLTKAGILSAKALIASLPVDADNLFLVLTARSMNPTLNIISRSSSASTEKKLKIAGVNSVVMPERVGGAHMAKLVARPDVLEFLEHLSIRGDDPTNIEEIECTNLSERFREKSIHELGIRKATGANIIGYKTPEGRYIVNPSPNTKMLPNSKLFVLGKKEEISKIKDFLCS
ncbi:MAG: potassium channel protein [Bacteroidales bacterium]|nr:potassium channel protein [Bacteroidales bacterium]